MAGDELKPRLCHVKKRADFNGYGFNLHAEKGKAGQFIGKVDPGSPAERAGLKEGDRIVEINGTNIGNENHQQVVQRVKAVPDETTLLVVDADADKYFKDNKTVIRGDMPDVVRKSSEPNGLANGADSPVANRSDSIPDGAPSPRRCHLKIWPDFQGYGFNLHAEKGKPGQFIGKVDDDSPAQMAGLREGDLIIEINDENIGQSTHKDVVSKIKMYPNEAKLLVLDAEADAYYKERDIVVSHSMANVKRIECPDTRQAASSNGSSEIQAEVVNHVESAKDDREDDRKSDDQDKLNDGEIAAAAIDASIREVEAAVSQEAEPEDEKEEENNNVDQAEDYDVIGNVPPPNVNDSDNESEGREPELPERTESPEPARAETPEPARAETPEPARVPTPEPVRDPSPVPEVAPPVYENAVKMESAKVETKKEEPKPSSPMAAEPASPTKKGPVVVGGIEFAGSAKEARERMSRKRRDEVKSQQISAKDKYDMLMRM